MSMGFCGEKNAYKVSNLSMSACEYEAPMIFLLSGGLDVFEADRQNGEAELARQSTWCPQINRRARHTKSGLHGSKRRG